MQCKVFTLKNLEVSVNNWFADHPRLSLVNITTLDTTGVILIFYTESTTVKLPDVPEGRGPTCPKCQKTMRVKSNRTTGELFWGCSGYSNGCTGTVKFTDEDEVLYGGELRTPETPPAPLQAPPVPQPPSPPKPPGPDGDGNYPF